MTLASIIQSLVLTVLLGQVFSNSFDTYSLDHVFRHICAFLLIIFVWHEYALGASAYPWKIGLLDSFIPFLLAATEYAFVWFSMPSSNTSSMHGLVKWLFSISAFSLVAALAYWNQEHKVRRDCQTRLCLKLKHFLPAHWGFWCALATAFILFLLATLLYLDAAWLKVFPDWCLSLLVILFSLGHLWRIHYTWDKLYPEFVAQIDEIKNGALI